MTSGTPRALLLTARPDLPAAVGRVAALAGMDLETAGSVDLPRWRAADVVLISGEAMAIAVRHRLPRRPHVFAVVDPAMDEATWASAVALGVEGVFSLPRDESGLLDTLALLQESDLEPARVVAITGAVGGAGASTVAATCARLAAEEAPTCLIDTDLLGGGLDLPFGAERSAGARWPDVAASTGQVSGLALRSSLPAPGGVALLTSSREQPATIGPSTARAVLGAAVRAGGLVVIDVTRGESALADAALSHADLVVVIVPATVRAVAATCQLAAQRLAGASRLCALARDPDPRHLVAAEIAEATGLRVIGGFESEPRIARRLEIGGMGEPIRRGSLRRAAGKVLSELKSTHSGVAGRAA